MISIQKAARQKVFQRQISRLDRQLEILEAVDRRFFWYRLVTLLGGSLAFFMVYLVRPGRPAWAVMLVAALIFAFVVAAHRRLDQRRTRARLTRQDLAGQLARLELDWPQIPLPAGPPPQPGHPFAPDLNLAGPRSLHHLLDTAMSTGGSARLAGWLLETQPDPQRVLARQALVRAVEPLTGLRRRLAVLGAWITRGPSIHWDGEGLLAWLEHESPPRPLLPALLALAGLMVANLVLFALTTLAGWPPFWLISFIAYMLVYYSRYRELGELFSDAQYLSATLDRFRGVLVYLEKYPYPSGSALARLCEPFWRPGRRPSRLLRRLVWIASAASMQNNPIFWAVLNALMPWDMYFAWRLDHARRDLQQSLPAWLDAWYELEAVNSLANFAYLNPGYRYPELVTEGPESNPGRDVFHAVQLGHPLIPEAEKVCNDFAFQQLGEAALVTGSNMSGKSTFLRTIGANLCLAYAGGPVNALSLETAFFRLFTCIQVGDSLSDGISYFYAEVRRLKALLNALEASDGFPLFYLIDEIFRGTNNRERQIGSRAYLRALAGRRGVGLVSTHDLELVKLVDELPQLHNYHFREDVETDRLVFDYRLRSGPSPTTNALKIMQLEGLPVGDWRQFH